MEFAFSIMCTSYCILLFLPYVYLCCCRYAYGFCENKADRKGLLLITTTDGKEDLNALNKERILFKVGLSFSRVSRSKRRL